MHLNGQDYTEFSSKLNVRSLDAPLRSATAPYVCVRPAKILHINGTKSHLPSPRVCYACKRFSARSCQFATAHPNMRANSQPLIVLNSWVQTERHVRQFIEIVFYIHPSIVHCPLSALGSIAFEMCWCAVGLVDSHCIESHAQSEYIDINEEKST